MKIGSSFRVFVFFMVILIFSMPFVTLAQQYSVRAEAEAAAKRDAEARVNKMVWRIFGCVGGLIIVAGSYLYEPSPPAWALIGKSPEYVAFYSDAYIQKSKNLQFRGAIEGCVASGCLWSVVLVGAAVAAEEAAGSGFSYWYH